VEHWVLHVDLDQFVVAVEVLRRPELRGLPVVVGTVGDPSRRGVVSGCSYEARTFGIRSGMALREAHRRCPQAVFLPPDFEAYRDASRRVMAALRDSGHVVEQAGWDEAFVDLRGTEPEHLARDIQTAVRDRTGLVCSVGIGDTKVRAKVATALAKPAGVFRLSTDNWLEVMGEYPPRRLWGIGPRTAARLAALGIHTVQALASADPVALHAEFGPVHGLQLIALGKGEGPSTVTAEQPPPRSHGHQRTFDVDTADAAALEREVASEARTLAGELALMARTATRVVVVLRFAPFDTHAHGVVLESPTVDADRLEAAALEALGRFSLDRPVRMLGVRAELAGTDSDLGAPLPPAASTP
jgi:DNA polymerase IV